VLGASTFHFTHFLELGMGDLEVWDLQWRLRAEGLYHGYITGYFSPATEVALRQYQLSHGLAITGYLDRQTRAEMN
jgi:N-acetylmuramoyl-L-alanine amidase